MTARHVFADQDGAVTITVALLIPVFILFVALVLTAGDWWVHKRHLQTQVDAAALASAQDWYPNCASLQSHMESVVADYGGTRNPQVEQTEPNVTFAVNKPTYPGQTKADDTPDADPCESMMVDVKATETGLAGPIPVGVIPTINAHARVQFFQELTQDHSLPIAVPDPAPKKVRVYFVDESKAPTDAGYTIASRELSADGTDAGGNLIWDNGTNHVDVTVGSRDKVGVRIATSGATSLTCGDPLVECYDDLSSNGLVFIHGYAGDTSGAQPNAPKVRGVTLTSTSCSDPYFSTDPTSCAVAVHATVDFGTGATNPATAPGVKASLRAVVNGTNYALTWSGGTWNSSETIPVAPGTGPIPIELQWAEQAGSVGGSTCKGTGDPYKTGNNGNPCTGSFGTVQRSFAGSTDSAGPIEMLQVGQTLADGTFSAGTFNSVRQCDSQNSTCTYSMDVRALTQASLQTASAANHPVVTLRTGDQNQTQALDCDPNISNLKDEIVAGCTPSYMKNTGTACPSTSPELWSSPQPWQCVAISTGTATNQIASGLNERILGSASTNTCTNPNRFDSELANGWDRNDPRIVKLLLVPFGSFSGTGSGTVPVVNFATFYVTGWSGSGQGFSNPCSAASGGGDDPTGGKGNIVGHFIAYVDLSGNPSTETCLPNLLTPCLGVLTR